jgi:hypothetical protein
MKVSDFPLGKERCRMTLAMLGWVRGLEVGFVVLLDELVDLLSEFFLLRET